ncbi:hypothetical protein D8M29_13390 [Micrococcus sp. HSID17227]|nr:hypothetical protein D8M29_13390 [Micrococcus sp. HSID17227]
MDALGAWFHPLTALLVALDAPIPPVPSEVVVIGSGALAAAVTGEEREFTSPAELQERPR